MHSESCKSQCRCGVKVALGGRFAALCQGAVHSGRCKSHCAGGVKVAWPRDSNRKGKRKYFKRKSEGGAVLLGNAIADC